MAASIVYNMYRLKISTPFYKHYIFKQVRHSSSEFLYSLIRRGLVKEIFPSDRPINFVGNPCAYAGFDATSDSLHIGNLLVLIALLHWRKAGYESIVVLGDTTAEIGDPSGHKTDRVILSRDIIHQNTEAIAESVLTIFDNYERYILPKIKKKPKCSGKFSILRNSEWYQKTSVLDFFSQSGRHIRVGDMLSRTSVRSRMESGAGINFSEFSYQVFQSYDWLYLFKNYNCRFQFGGSDQLGNITSGYNLISGSEYKLVYGALLPLIETESGDKFGKTAGNAVYLSPTKTSPFDFYQFFMRLPDSSVQKFLSLFTFLSSEEIEAIVKSHMKDPGLRNGQRKIAEHVTLLIHGGIKYAIAVCFTKDSHPEENASEQGLKAAEMSTKVFYHSDVASLAKLNIDEVKQIFPLSAVSEIPFEAGISILNLAMKVGCFLNEGDAKRIITGGGMYLNFERITSPEAVLVPSHHILPNNISLIRIGKKNYYIVIWR